jgi:hypothetical protein
MLISLGLSGLRILLYWGIAAAVGLIYLLLITVALVRFGWSGASTRRKRLETPYPEALPLARRISRGLSRRWVIQAETAALLSAAAMFLVGVLAMSFPTYSHGPLGAGLDDCLRRGAFCS